MPVTPASPAPGEEQAARFAAELVRLRVTPDDRLAVAVSGGPDSLALLILARAAHPGRLIAATVDHGLRPEAAAEAAGVAAICAALGVEHHILPVSVAEAGEGMQAAARDARYAALADWCVAHGIERIATAHHADDQAETLLMRLNRGAGLAGLAGVRAARWLRPGLRLVRPLLGWRKAELVAIVADAGITPVDDPANRDARHDRTAIRALLAANPLLDPLRIAASAAHLADSEAALDWVTRRVIEGRIEQQAGGMVLDHAGLPREIRRRAVSQILYDFSVITDGPGLATLLSRLESGQAATLGGVKATPGERWTFAPAPPRRGDH